MLTIKMVLEEVGKKDAYAYVLRYWGQKGFAPNKPAVDVRIGAKLRRPTKKEDRVYYVQEYSDDEGGLSFAEVGRLETDPLLVWNLPETECFVPTDRVLYNYVVEADSLRGLLAQGTNRWQSGEGDLVVEVVHGQHAVFSEEDLGSSGRVRSLGKDGTDPVFGALLQHLADGAEAPSDD